ncbi:hypothetical protein SRABI76_01877 [Microbacterium oxydans]|uniref:DUF2332 domain-containing protein n=1 Tax=Microbacterium oxydans TaxID=82380 RepID=A0A0F0L7Q5_9MICO|nr:DUF2332 domain-containing protein [Microbacterium oxydans]KJL28719.1 hypothetical protein RS83_02198 [Microbacterium oxydans]CAH0195260.1 hypothetical protein SRABI76_01877 [Microbacterium oxydans]
MNEAVQERYARFVRQEAAGRSALYGEWADGVAGDAEVQDILARIPETSRQPPLVFAVTRLLGAPLEGYQAWRSFVLEHADAVVAECRARSLQTNEPLRLAPLLPVLSEIEGPIALLEIGASGGLCLYPDRYSFRFLGTDGALRASLDPADGPSSVVLESVVTGELPPLRLPDVVWRAGIDLAPLNARDERDRRWLLGLVWPGEAGREERIGAALDIAAADPPRLVAGDALDELTSLAAEAPSDATLVITTPGVLVHIPRPIRTELVDRIRALPARWITIDPPALLDVWQPAVDAASWPGFVVALDGRVRAAADPLGRSWEWRAGSADDAS